MLYQGSRLFLYLKIGVKIQSIFSMMHLKISRQVLTSNFLDEIFPRLLIPLSDMNPYILVDVNVPLAHCSERAIAKAKNLKLKFTV